MMFAKRQRQEPAIDYHAFSPPLLRLQESPPNPLGRKVLHLLVGAIVAVAVWAFFGRLDIVAVAEGKLVPGSYLKIVQPAESGIVKEILVREGEVVRADQVLMRMDSLITESEAKAIESDWLRRRLTLRRIDAELGGKPFVIEAGDPEALFDEVAARFRANREALEANLAEERSRLARARAELASALQVADKLNQVLPHFRKQDKAFEKLADDGFASGIMASDKRRERVEKEQELLTQSHLIESAKAGIAQSEKKLLQIDSEYRRQLHAERNDAQSAIEKLTQELAKVGHRRGLLDLKAPQDAVVKDLATHTVGTVVQPGTVLLTLVPRDDVLRAEVWVSNEDIGFVRQGLPVKLKFATYPFQKYGMVHGVVEHLSADSADTNTAAAGAQAAGERSGGRGMPLVYKALIALDAMHLEMDGERFPLSTGMQSTAEILLGTRTVAEYLLSPVRKAWHDAARER